MQINDEGQRVLINLAQHYDAWIAAERGLIDGRLQWKTIGAGEYLYRIIDRQGNGISLGRRGADTERQYEAFRHARQTRDDSHAQLRVDAALYRALRLPQLPDFAGAVLRELDRRKLLGASYQVAGTNAIVAYAIEAVTLPPLGIDTTDDFDLTWVEAAQAGGGVQPPNTLLAALKKIDATYTINTEREFQVRNRRGQEVELLLPAALAGGWAREQKLRPIPLPEQDWLLRGRQVSHVVCDTGGEAARLVVPDPRWFGLHKLWLSQKPGRQRLKIAKDERQGMVVLDLVAEAMPHFPMDAAFRAELPDELLPHVQRWEARRAAAST